MVNPRMPAEWTIALGEGAEVLADKYSISREEQDEFALGSHQQGRGGVGGRAGSTPRSSRVDGDARARRVHPAGHHRGEAGRG